MTKSPRHVLLQSLSPPNFLNKTQSTKKTKFTQWSSPLKADGAKGLPWRTSSSILRMAAPYHMQALYTIFLHPKPLHNNRSRALSRHNPEIPLAVSAHNPGLSQFSEGGSNFAPTLLNDIPIQTSFRVSSSRMLVTFANWTCSC